MLLNIKSDTIWYMYSDHDSTVYWGMYVFRKLYLYICVLNCLYPALFM